MKSMFLILLIICMPFVYSIDIEEISTLGGNLGGEESITRYVYGLNGLVASVKDNKIRYHQNDVLGVIV
jgi:hypothetical protein